MLSSFTATRVGFNNSLRINDVFEIDGDKWIIRYIGNFEIKKRVVEGFFGKRGVQKDVIVAEVVAQKTGTYNLSNIISSTHEIDITFETSEKNIWKHGDFGFIENIGYLAINNVSEISFSFVDITISAEGETVTELPAKEINKLVLDKTINQLGWQI